MKTLQYIALGVLLAPAAVAQDTNVVPETVEIPAGFFYMGSNGLGHDYDEAPIHRVEITRPFRMGVTEVTNLQYEQFDPGHKRLRGKYGFSKEDDEAVVFVSWYDATAYCAWLSEKEGKTYRLPTEAEWEYAARAGNYYKYGWGGVFPDNMKKNNFATHHETYSFEPVDLHSMRGGRAHPFGLYDMHGNVEEWCLDWYGPYLPGTRTDPVGYADGEFRVTRGGSHSTPVEYLRSANRSAMLPGDKHYLTGFRVVQADYPESAPLHREAPADRSVSQQTHVWHKADTAVFMEPVEFVKAPECGSGVPFYRHNHQPAITWCPNGDLLAIWFSTDSEFGREMTVLSSRMEVGTNEWQRPKEFYKVPDRNMTGAALFHDKRNGTLIHMNGVEAAGWWRNLAVVMRKSHDNGATWTKGKLVLPEHCPGHQVIAGTFCRADGTLVQVCDAMPSMEGGSIVHTSDDGGETWRTRGEAGNGDFAAGKTGRSIAGIHAGVVELRNGDLFALGRTGNIPDKNGVPRMPVSVSKDGGETWTYSASVFPPIRGGQRLVLMRLDEGPILLVSFDPGTKDDSQPRGMYASLSYDEGKSWSPKKFITDGKHRFMDGGAWTGHFIMDSLHAEPKGYLAATQTPDGIIHLLSSKNHYRFNLRWLEQ